ncbi:MAG: LysE family transporter [Calditrichaeota bacterium]|nr:LysE family transporter [Calditrichota bacterium]
MMIIFGFVVGFIASVPVGPLNLFAISQVVKRGFWHGFLVGLTSASLDVVYVYLALIGFSHLAFNFSEVLPFIKVLAIVLLTGMSIRLFKQARHFQKPKSRDTISAAHRPIITALFLYLTNPALYAFWLAVAGFATTHHWVAQNEVDPVVFALSTGLGASTWYFILIRYVDKYHHQFKNETFKKMFIIIALALLGFAIYTFISFFK